MHIVNSSIWRWQLLQEHGDSATRLQMAIHSNTLSLKHTTLTASSHAHIHVHKYSTIKHYEISTSACYLHTHRQAVIKWCNTKTHYYYITLTAPSITISLSYIHMCRHTHIFTVLRNVQANTQTQNCRKNNGMNIRPTQFELKVSLKYNTFVCVLYGIRP